ncbi:unnamed protein product [Effrenium voratum]|nr:unnamed protein product [Effrenium voratum]
MFFILLLLTVCPYVARKVLERSDSNEAIGWLGVSRPSAPILINEETRTLSAVWLNVSKVNSAKSTCSSCCKKDPYSPDILPWTPGDLVTTHYREAGLLSQARSSALATAMVKKMEGTSVQVQLLSLKDSTTFAPGDMVRAHLPIGSEKKKSPDPLPAVVVNSTDTETTVRYKHKFLGELSLANSWIEPSWAMSNQFIPAEWIQTAPREVPEVDCSLDQFEACISTSGCVWKEPVYEEVPCVVADWGEWNPCTVTCGVGKQRRIRPFPTQPSCRRLEPAPVVQEDRFCMQPSCPLVPDHCQAAPNASASLLQFYGALPAREESAASASAPSWALGALLELLAESHFGKNPRQAIEQELQNIASVADSKETGPSTFQQHPLYVEGETVIAWAEKGTGLGPQCPESYFAIQIDIDVQRNVVSAACNHCAAGCLHCNGPGADQCTACPAPLRLYTHIDGRSTCVEACPECFRPSDEEDDACVFDGSQFGCDHVAAFHPEVMPEHRGAPDSCQALDMEDGDEQPGSKTALLSWKSSAGRSSLSSSVPSVEELAGEPGRIEAKKEIIKQTLHWLETEKIPELLDGIAQYADATLQFLASSLVQDPELLKPLALALGHSPESAPLTPPASSRQEASAMRDVRLAREVREQSRFGLWTNSSEPHFSEVLHDVAQTLAKVALVELQNEDPRRTTHADGDSGVAGAMAEQLQRDAQDLLRFKLLKFDLRPQDKDHLLKLGADMVQALLSSGIIDRLAAEITSQKRLPLEEDNVLLQSGSGLGMAHKLEVKSSKLSGVALALLSSGQQAMDRQLQRLLTQGAIAFGLSAEEKANLTGHLEGEVHAELRALSQGSVAKIMHDVSEDLRTDELRDEVLAASRAVLASELGKLAAEAKTLAAEKLEEKIQLAAIGTKLEKKQLDSAVREVLEHAEVSAADALWAAQTVLSESAAINERVKKSSASALMQLRTGQWQAATSKIAAEAPMFMAELVIFQRMSSRLDHFVQALSESLHLDLSEVGPGPAPHAAVQRAAQETLQQAIAAQSQSPWKEQLAARLKGRVWRLVQNKCRALTGTDMEEVRRQVADAFQSFDLPQDDMVFQLQEDLEHAVEEVALENRQEAEDSYLEALSRQDDSASAHCLGVCLESANDLAEFLGDLSAYALHETHRSLSPAEQRAWKLGRVRAKADHGLLAVVKAAASSAQQHCTENRTGFVQAVKADVRREADRARHSLMLQLEDLVAANKTGVTAKEQQRFMTLVDERLWKPMEEAVLSYRPCGADSTSPRNQAQLLYHGTVRRLLQEASIKLAAKWSTKMESLNSVLLEEAFWPKVGARRSGDQGFPNGIILLETEETDETGESVESLLSQAQATLTALEVTGKPKKLPSTKPSERRQKMVTAMGDWAANNKDDLEAYYYKARDSAISNAVELLYGKGALGPPLCKAATTLGENLDQSYAKALEVRNGNMFSTFKEAGDLACKLEWGIDEVVQFITNIYDILQTFKILLKMVSGLPIVGVLAKVLDKPVVYLMKFMDRELIPVRDRLRDNFHPKFELACEFQKTVVTRVGYAIEAIRVLKLQAFPANKAAGLVGEAMNVCAWLPPVALLADGALTSVASLDSLAGASTDLVRDMVSWVETLIPTSALKKMESSNQIMNVILLPVRKTEATLSTVYKVCIPAVKCWKFTLLGLLKALSNFLEKIFNFALKPFQPIVEAAVAPVRRTLEKAFSSLLPPLQIPFPEFSGLFEDEPSLMDLVRNAFRTDTDQTFSGQIEKAMQLTKKQASYCYSYGTELPAAEGICNDISAKYGAVRNPFECQQLCQSACSRCVRWSFVTTDAAVGAGVCRFTRSNAYYEVKSPTSVSGPKTCGDVTKYQPDTFVQHVESRLCKDMGAFPEIKGAEACKKACFVDGDCQVVQMSGGMCYVGAGKKGCSRGPTSMSLHKTRTAKEALQTRCNAATGVQRAAERLRATCPRSVQDCDAWALEEATKEVQGAGSQAVQEVMELTSTSYQKFTCELLELDVDCPDVNKGDKVDSFDKCKEGAEFVFKESEEEIKKQIDAEVQEQLAACRREAHESLKPLCPVFSWRGIKREKNKKVPPKFKNQYCLLRQKIQASAAYCDYLIKTHGSFGGKTSTTLAAEVRASFVPTESCAKASGDQFLCEMKFLNEGGGETKQMDLTNQIQLQNMYQAKQFDNLAAETQKVKQELAGIQTQMDEGFSKTREQLFSMDKAAANRTEEQTRQIFEKLESSQKEQNARMAYMMQAAQCDSKLQTKELKDFMTSGLNNLQSAVLSGTGQQIDEATSKIKDAVANSQRAVQKQMKESFTDLKDTVTEGFDQVQNKLDANRKAIQKQMTDRFNAVDQKLVHVQGQLDSALKGIETVDNRIKDLARQSSRQFQELHQGQQRQMNALLAIVQKLEVIEDKIDDIPAAIRESRFQDFIYQFKSLTVSMENLLQQFQDFSDLRRGDITNLQAAQAAYRSCSGQLDDVLLATRAVKQSSAEAMKMLRTTYNEVVQRFGQVAILAVDAGFSKMHFEALAEQIAEDLLANKSQLELFLAQESLQSVIVADQDVLYGKELQAKCSEVCVPQKVSKLEPCTCSDGRRPLQRVAAKYLFTPAAATMLLEWTQQALDDVPLKYSIVLKDLYTQITYLERKFASFDLEPPSRARDQFWADWERIAFDMESIRKSYAMVDTKERAVLGKLQLSQRFLDTMASFWSPAPLECHKPALMELGESSLGHLALWSPLKQKGGGAAWLILRQPSRLLQTSALSWMHDAHATDCRAIPDGYDNLEGLMQSGFVCWTDSEGTAKVRSLCDPRGLEDVVETSGLKWVSEEKFSEFGSQNPLLVPIATSEFRTTPLEAEVFSYWERQMSFIAAAQCGNGKLDITEECDSPGEGCEKCKSVPGYECPVPGQPCQSICGDHTAVKMEDCDESDHNSNDGCTPFCQLEYCPRRALSLPIKHAQQASPNPSPELELCASQSRGGVFSLEGCGSFSELVFAGFTMDGHWVRHDIRLDATLASMGNGPWASKASGWVTLGAPYKLWNDGTSVSVTCRGADTSTGCLFWCGSLVNSSDCIQPWLVQTHSNRSQDVHAERLLVYGRKSAAATDLQSCEGGAKLVSLSCGDGQITGNEECDPPGGCCDAQCKLASGWQWQDGCKAICGDGVVLGEEQCDPPMEGCDQQCKLEDGWKWVQNKTTTTCGDSLVAGEEQCDPPSECCNTTCSLETGWLWQDGGCKREVNCGAVTASFGMGIGWNSPATVREGILSQPGERGYRLQNVPAELIGGKYIGHKTWPSKSGGTWTISYTTPVTLYVWVVKEEHNAGIDAMLSNDGWAFVAAPGFKRSDGPALHVWKRFFATGSTYLIKTKELMVGGVISSQDCEVSCGAVTGSSGMGIPWNSPATVKEGVLSQPGQRAYTLQNVPAELIGGTYVGHKTWPSNSGGTWTISYTAPVTLYVWVVKEKHNAGIDAMLSNDGWAPVAAPGFQRSDGWALHVWKRHFATGSTYLIKTTELMVGGVISKAIPSACKVSCGAVAGSSGMGIPWNSPAIVKEGILSQPGQRGYTLQNVPAELIGGTYIGHQAWPSKSGGTWNITYQAPVILYVWVVKEKHNAGIDAMLSNDGWAPVAAPGFQRSDGWTLHVWKRYFGSGSTYLIKTTELMVGGVISSKVSSECKAAATCGAVAGSSGMGIPWNSPAIVKEGILSQPGQRDYKLQNVPAELIGGSYIGHQAWPSKSGGTWTISYTSPVTLYVFVMKDLHNAGVDAMLSNDDWVPVEAPGFQRSDGWAFHVWKRFFDTGSTYLIKTKELMIGGVISKALPEECEVSCGAATSSSGMDIRWNSPATVKEGVLSQPGQRNYELQNVPAELLGGSYIGHQAWPSKSGGTWTISYTSPVTLYVWVMKEMHNAGVDAMLSNDGWARVEAPGFQRSDGWALHVWKRYFATGSTYVIKTKELMVGGVVSKVLSKKCKVSCGAVAGSSGMGISWNSPATVREGMLSQPGQRDYKLQNVPAELIGGSYTGHQAWPSKSGGTWTISYTTPVTLYVIVLKDLHNAGVDAMLSNDGWAAVEAPGFKRSDGWAFNVWKRYFATGNTYLIKTKELMIGGVISSKVSSQGCEA